MKKAIKESYELLVKEYLFNQKDLPFKFSAVKGNTKNLLNIAKKELKETDELLKDINDFFKNLK